MTPASKFTPGEYGFMNMMSVKMQGSKTQIYTIYVFGIG